MKTFTKNMLILSCLLGFINSTWGQASWTQRASLVALNGRLGATGFSIGHYGYIGGGQTPTGPTNDFWRWNQNTNTWSSIASYPGLGRYCMTSFTIAGKGYTCLGWSGAANEKDMWEYDSATNSWTQKASFPGSARYGAFVFVIGTNAYVGCGEPNGQPYDQDMWEYNSITNTWRQRANFPGGNRAGLAAFSFGKYGYAGCGGDGFSDYNDMWQYDTALNTWTNVASLPVPTNQLGAPITFVIKGQAYVGTGQDMAGSHETRDFWSYDSATGLWSPVVTLTGVARWNSVGFTVGNKGYVGMGWDSANNYLTDYWEYYPYADTIPLSVNKISNNTNTANLYPNPNNGTFVIETSLINAKSSVEIYNMMGEKVYEAKLPGTDGKLTIEMNGKPAGVYLYRVLTETGYLQSDGKFIIQR